MVSGRRSSAGQNFSAMVAEKIASVLQSRSPKNLTGYLIFSQALSGPRAEKKNPK